MRLKMDKEQFLSGLRDNVHVEIQNAFAVQYNYYGQPTNINLNELISTAINAAVVTAIRDLIEAQYTDEDFERDMGLK